MSGINFLSENFVDNSTISITTGAANAQFPASNIQNDSPSIKFRSTGNTVVLEFDLGQTRALNSVAVVGDPTGVFGLTAAYIKTSVTTDFSSSPQIDLDLSSAHNFGFKFFTEVAHRYVELTMTGTGSYAELSNIFLGDRINLTQNNLSITSFKYGYMDKSTVVENRYGQKFIDQRNSVKNLSGSIEFCTQSEQSTLDDMFIYHNKNKPIWILIDDAGAAITDGEYKLSVYGYLKDVPEWSATGGQTYSTNVDVVQAI